MSRPIDRALSSRARDRRDFALFAGPAVLLFGGLLMAPVAFMFAISLLEWPGLTKPWRFVGLENYARLLSDDFFWRAATNTVVHLVVGIAIIMPIAFLLGYFLAQRRPGTGRSARCSSRRR
ncbi:MAG: hypothetical protein M5T61_09470 [Acidimicrobiia bacterium]|nr:hypothetical protein [Acidimicrobiia bacterium]